jgi:outer membrane scaffolding protein for murein synthesis (MipA/OmpV family)
MPLFRPQSLVILVFFLAADARAQQAGQTVDALHVSSDTVLVQADGNGASSSQGAAEAQDAAASDEFVESDPLWEVGIVAAGGWLPDYPAADENHFRFVPLPYAIYRGEVFRLGDRGAARGIVADEESFEIDLGIDAAFPVDSDDNDAREDMSSLDLLLEAGPRFTYRFLPKQKKNEVDLSIAGRAVISTDGKNWRYQGIIINPALVYRRNHMFGHDFRGVLSVGSLFGYDGMNRYFYRVSDQDARPGRPQYEADDGYIGTEFSAGFSWGIIDNLRAFGGVQLGYWGGSANDDSPLHRDNTTFTVGGGIRWSFFTSEERVER